MRKGKIVLFSGLLMLSITSCKEEKALSKIDPASSDINLKEYMIPQQTAETLIAEEAAKVTVPTNGKYPVMIFDKKEHDFGNINDGDKVETTFTVSNAGEADLVITNASGTCGCTVPDYPKQPIKPGSTAKIKVSFDSSGKPGMQQKSVNITANTERGTDVLTIKANVNPKQTN
ncbi:MAG: DUF1573 domain-containing protein [Flavobacteriaceae bacterium]|jgi:hypothetical protein|nr:DUF1573 domain-containing protein [Flavobacteriaceae bacterium]